MKTILDVVGNTPMVQLGNFAKEYPVEVFAKLEYFNPTSSMKDRIAKYMIEKAEKDGRLKEGDTIIENSSGNTATGLAMISKQKGYNLKLVIRNTLSPDKRSVLEAFGVELIPVDPNLDPNDPYSYNRYAKTYAENNEGVWFCDQHDNMDNPEAHYHTTGKEILEQSNGELDYFVAGMGTGGTISGIGRALKEHNPNIKIIAVDPIGSVFKAYFYDEKLPKPQSHYLEGIGNALPTKNVMKEYIDEVMELDSRLGIEYVHKLIKSEGIIAGPSAGANLWGVIEIAKKCGKNAKIGTLIGDTGYKYTSTLFNKEWLDKIRAV